MAKILVVDDEPGIIRFVRRALEADGHTVLTAPDGSTALTLSSEQDPDLVILDLLMPGLSGLGCLAAILAERPHTRVLVLSAVGDVQMRVRCLELGATDYLMKPFAIAELVARVNKRAAEAEARNPRLTRPTSWSSVACAWTCARAGSSADDASIELSQREAP